MPTPDAFRHAAAADTPPNLCVTTQPFHTHSVVACPWARQPSRVCGLAWPELHHSATMHHRTSDCTWTPTVGCGSAALAVSAVGSSGLRFGPRPFTHHRGMPADHDVVTVNNDDETATGGAASDMPHASIAGGTTPGQQGQQQEVRACGPGTTTAPDTHTLTQTANVRCTTCNRLFTRPSALAKHRACHPATDTLAHTPRSMLKTGSPSRVLPPHATHQATASGRRRCPWCHCKLISKKRLELHMARSQCGVRAGLVSMIAAADVCEEAKRRHRAWLLRTTAALLAQRRADERKQGAHGHTTAGSGVNAGRTASSGTRPWHCDERPDVAPNPDGRAGLLPQTSHGPETPSSRSGQRGVAATSTSTSDHAAGVGIALRLPRVLFVRVTRFLLG